MNVARQLMRGLRVVGSLVALVAVACLKLPASAHAQGLGDPGVQVFSVQQADLDGDGQPDQTTIECSFATPNDGVLVFDSGDNMRVSNDWQEATETIDNRIVSVLIDGFLVAYGISHVISFARVAGVRLLSSSSVSPTPKPVIFVGICARPLS